MTHYAASHTRPRWFTDAGDDQRGAKLGRHTASGLASTPPQESHSPAAWRFLGLSGREIFSFISLRSATLITVLAFGMRMRRMGDASKAPPRHAAAGAAMLLRYGDADFARRIGLTHVKFQRRLRFTDAPGRLSRGFKYHVDIAMGTLAR